MSRPIDVISIVNAEGTLVKVWLNMNRHERRMQAKGGAPREQAAPAPVAPIQRPGFALRLFAGLLLSNWVLKRVHHPDLMRILMQVAQQVGRTDAIAQLALKMYGQPK